MRHLWFRLGILLSLTIAPLTTGGCGKIMLISTEQEIAMGEEAAPQLEAEFGGPVPNETLQAYVRAIGARLVKSAQRDVPYEYTLVSSDVPNAFALPGGKIFVTAGLVKIMSTERQLAGVLAHETAHVEQRHSVQQIQNQMASEVLVEVLANVAGDRAAAAKAGGQVVSTMVNLRYSRDDEREADSVGADLMTRAGYNPWGMVELLQALASVSQEQQSAIGGIFRTHPYTAERIENTRSLIAQNYADFRANQPDPGAEKFKDMRRLMMQELDWSE